MSTLASHIQTESEAIEALRQSIRDREAECLEAYGELDEARARIRLLEETLRGILQEKRDRLEESGPSKARDLRAQEIAWLESVLGGNP